MLSYFNQRWTDLIHLSRESQRNDFVHLDGICFQAVNDVSDFLAAKSLEYFLLINGVFQTTEWNRMVNDLSLVDALPILVLIA